MRYTITLDESAGTRTETINAGQLSTGALDGMLVATVRADIVFAAPLARVISVIAEDAVRASNSDEDTARSAARGARSLDRR